MRRLLSAAAVVMVWASACAAQESDVDLRRDEEARFAHPHVTASGVVAPTPGMWFYEQEMRRLDDPKMAVRRKAELRAQQRMDRMAAMAWYGMSNSRPTATSLPHFGGSYSPYWGSTNFDPLRWRPITPSYVAERPTERAN